MKYLFLLLIGMTVISCESQIRTDLLALKFDENILPIVQRDPQLKKDQDSNLGLRGYTTNKPGNYAIAGVKLSTYAFPNGNLADENSLSLFTTDTDKPNYLGFKYTSVDQEETKAIVDYLKKAYPNYKQGDKNGKTESFFWEVPTLNAWIFMYQGISNDKNDQEFFTSNFIVVKRGTRMENSNDPKVISIKEYYNMMYPGVIK